MLGFLKIHVVRWRSGESAGIGQVVGMGTSIHSRRNVYKLEFLDRRSAIVLPDDQWEVWNKKNFND